MGFKEAKKDALAVIISEDPNTVVSVVSPAGMSILKIIAWTDRDANKRKKDATDFLYLLSEYEKIPSVKEGVYNNEKLLEKYNGDIVLAASYLLGRHARNISEENTFEFIRDFFEDKLESKKLDRFIFDSIERNRDHEYQRHEELVNAYINGFVLIKSLW